jgi:geranylgeranyl pyrophosphate synthase
MDLSESTPDLSVCWNIAEAKSGSAFGLACYSGSRLATRQSDVLQSMRSFGRLLGTIVQISDDLEDLQQPATRSQQDKLGAVFGAYTRFIESRIFSQHDHPPKYDLEQQQNVIRNGTVLYLRFEAVKYAEKARKELLSLDLAEKPKVDLLALLGQVSIIGGRPN